MQSNDVIEVVAPLGAGICEVALFPDAAAVLTGTACVFVEPGRVFFAAGRNLSSLESDVDLFVRRVESPVIGGDGEIAGVLCRNSPLRSASTPLTQYQDTVIIGEAANTILHDIANLLATVDCGLQLLERQTEVEGRQLIVDRMRHSVRRVAVSSRELLGGNCIQQNGRTDITTRRDLVAAVEDLRHAIGPWSITSHRDCPRSLRFCRGSRGPLLRAPQSVPQCERGAATRWRGRNLCEEQCAASRGVEWGGGHHRCGQRKRHDGRSGSASVRLQFHNEASWARFGFGLGQVRQFVQESGGAIEIKSEVGVGTAVRVMLLPVSRPADGNSADPSNSIATF
jgi:hypothetical protein